MDCPSSESFLSLAFLQYSLSVQDLRFKAVATTAIVPQAGSRCGRLWKGLIQVLVMFIRGVLCNCMELAAENLAPRQQLPVLREMSKQPRLRPRDRIFWAILSRIWPN